MPVVELNQHFCYKTCIVLVRQSLGSLFKIFQALSEILINIIALIKKLSVFGAWSIKENIQNCFHYHILPGIHLRAFLTGIQHPVYFVNQAKHPVGKYIACKGIGEI